MPDDWITTKMIAAGSDATNDVVGSLAGSRLVVSFYLKMFISIFFSFSFLPSFQKKGVKNDLEQLACPLHTFLQPFGCN